MSNLHTEPDAPSLRPARRRSRWVAVGLISVSLVAVTGCSDDTKDPAAAAATPAGATTTLANGSPTTGGKGKASAKASANTPKAIARAARKAVDRDNYASAVSIAAKLPVAKRKPIGKRVANRLARRAALALKEGNRSAVLSLLAESKKYPKTKLMTKVRADYRAAEKAFEKRGDDRLVARQAKLRQERAAREARAARERALKANAKG